MFSHYLYVVSFLNEFTAWWQHNTRENINVEDSTLLYGLVKLPRLALLSRRIVALFVFQIKLRETIMTERYLAIQSKTGKFFFYFQSTVLLEVQVEQIPHTFITL